MSHQRWRQINKIHDMKKPTRMLYTLPGFTNISEQPDNGMLQIRQSKGDKQAEGQTSSPRIWQTTRGGEG